jgi:hypothetical protein
VIYLKEDSPSGMDHEIKNNSIHILNMRRENIFNSEIGEIEGSGFEARIKDSQKLIQMMRKKIGDDKETVFVENFLSAGGENKGPAQSA